MSSVGWNSLKLARVLRYPMMKVGSVGSEVTRGGWNCYQSMCDLFDFIVCRRRFIGRIIYPTLVHPHCMACDRRTLTWPRYKLNFPLPSVFSGPTFIPTILLLYFSPARSVVYDLFYGRNTKASAYSKTFLHFRLTKVVTSSNVFIWLEKLCLPNGQQWTVVNHKQLG